MKIVAVAACTVGIAHTYIAQKAIEDECARRGIECKCETQGGIGIEGEERFEALQDAGKCLTIDPSEVIAHPVEIIDRLIAM